MSLLTATALASLLTPLPCGQPQIGDIPAPSPLPELLFGGEAKLERDPFGVPNSLASENFRVMWGDVDPIDKGQAMAVLDAMEASWTAEIEDMAYPAPMGTQMHLLNVYIGDSGDGAPPSLGAAGYYNLDPENYPMLVMARSIVVEGGDFARHTAAHEFYHAVQGSLGRFPYSGISAWLWESTAQWIEHEVFPEGDSYALFLFGYAYLPQYPLNYFDYPDTWALPEYYQYGAFVFHHYLTDQVTDDSIIRDVWLDPTAELDPLVLIADHLGAIGLDLNEVWLDHAAHNVLWDYEDHDVLADAVELYLGTWPESANLVIAEVPAEGTTEFTFGPSGTLPRRYGSNTIRMQTPVAGNLRVQVHGVAAGNVGTAARWGARVVREYADHIDYETIPFELGEFYEGELLVEGVGEEEAIWLVVGAWTDETAPSWETEEFAYEYAMSPELPSEGTTGGSDSSTGGSDTGTDTGTGGGESSGSVDSTGDDSDATSGGLTPTEDEGCGCTTTSPRPGDALFMLSMFALLGVTRRRRADPPPASG